MEQVHKDVLRKNHTKLCKLISADVRPIVNYLQEHRIISDSMREDVTLITKTATVQASDLLYLLPRRGRNAFHAFYDALLEADIYDAADILRPEKAPHGPAYEPSQQHSIPQGSASSSSGLAVEEMSEDEDLPDHWPLTNEELDLKVTVKTLHASKTPDRWQRQYDHACLPAGQKDFYQMIHKKRGLCLIINNETFEYLDDRTGTLKDVNDLNFLFSGLGFNVLLYKDKTSEEIWSLLHQKVKQQDHSSSDCLVLIMLTHGDKGVVFGVKGYVDENGRPHDCIEVESLRNLVCSVPTLIYKPKLIFLQACRGKKKDLGLTNHRVKKDKLKNDLPEQNMDGCPGTPEGGQSQPCPAQESDIDLSSIQQVVKNFHTPGSLDVSAHKPTSNTNDTVDAAGENVATLGDAFLAMSTTEGYLSWRNTISGTWFIQAIVYVFSRFAYKHNIFTLMTKVNRLVSQAEEERYGYKQVCEFTPTLTKEFRFFPRLSKEN